MLHLRLNQKEGPSSFPWTPVGKKLPNSFICSWVPWGTALYTKNLVPRRCIMKIICHVANPAACKVGLKLNEPILIRKANQSERVL
ncbi:hypothetical protein VNO78_02045 [Psophocarpus tetragonolobus]|uniref:Uncharacterized protein n=1 Tax=Psophocarpus tetragonolobus TaxID=3891 RepID=A0AAN9XUY2_PSOTE